MSLETREVTRHRRAPAGIEDAMLDYHDSHIATSTVISQLEILKAMLDSGNSDLIL